MVTLVSQDYYGVFWDCLAGRVNLAYENEAWGSWGQEVHILHVNI